MAVADLTDAEPDAGTPGGDQPRAVAARRSLADRVYRGLATAAGISTFVVMGLIGLFLAVQAWPALKVSGWGFLTEQSWTVNDKGDFGVAALLFGTIVIALIALAIAIPIAIGAALYLTEYAPRRVRRPLVSLIDLMAAIPSLVFGLWGLFFLQPQMLGLSQWLANHLGFLPIFQVSGPTENPSTFAASPFIAGTVVALMVLPIATSVIREVFSQAPPVEREGALALGATRFTMIRAVVLPFGRGGMVGGIMLGLGRALGETIAVALIISPLFEIRRGILDTGGASIAGNIAQKYGEASGLSLNALVASGLVLFVVTLAVNLVASFIVSRSRSSAGVEL